MNPTPPPALKFDIPYQDVLFTALSVVFMAWPLLLVSPLQRRKGVLTNMIAIWVFLGIVRVILTFNPRPTLTLISEPLNTSLFFAAGGLLFIGLLITRLTKRRRTSRTPSSGVSNRR